MSFLRSLMTRIWPRRSLLKRLAVGLTVSLRRLNLIQPNAGHKAISCRSKDLSILKIMLVAPSYVVEVWAQLHLAKNYSTKELLQNMSLLIYLQSKTKFRSCSLLKALTCNQIWQVNNEIKIEYKLLHVTNILQLGMKWILIC